MSTSCTPLTAALELAELGYHVHPLKPGSKAPATQHGHQDASHEPALIQTLPFSARSNLGIALAATGLLVVAPDCPARLAEFTLRGLPATLTAQSGSGDGHRHFYYRLPEGAPAHRLCVTHEYDILANGYVVAPPSVTSSAYRWLTPLRPVAELPEAPAWAVELLRTAAAAEAAKPPPAPRPSVALNLSDQDILERAREHKTTGAKFRRLFDGDLSAHDGTDRSHSGADLALLSMLTYYTQDEAQLDRLFGQSGLYRPEHWRSGYRAATLRKALSRTTFYEPARHRPAASDNGHAPPEPAATATERATVLSVLPVYGATRALAESLGRQHHFARDPSGALFVYDAGVYRSGGEAFVAGEVKRRLADWSLNGEKGPLTWSRNRAAEVAAYLAADAPLLWERPPINEVVVVNGILDVLTGQMRDHDPDYLSVIQLPVRYDARASCPNWERFVATTFPDDAYRIAWEILADAMTTNRSDQRALLFLGDGENGKSRFLQATRAFLGRANVHTASLHQLADNRFERAALYGKLANVCADIPSTHLADTSIFKALTGGDAISAERKYRDSFSFEPFARLLFSANTLPTSGDASHAFFRRWEVLPFTKRFEGTDRIPAAELDAILSDPGELSGALNKALAVTGDVQLYGFTTTPSMAEAWDEFRDATDPLAGWMHDHLEYVVMEMVHRRRVFEAWSRHCKVEGFNAGTPNAFYRRIRETYPRVEDDQRTIDGKQDRAFVGLRLREGRS